MAVEVALQTQRILVQVANMERKQLGRFPPHVRNCQKIAFPLVANECTQHPFEQRFVLSPGEGHITILTDFDRLRTRGNDRRLDYESTSRGSVTRGEDSERWVPFRLLGVAKDTARTLAIE